MPSDEQSKALEEAAKALVQYKPEVRSLGKFLGDIVGHPSKQFLGLFGDLFGIARIEILLRYEKRVKRIMKERNMEGPQRPIPLSVAYPLLEAASLEEDGDLCEMFAQLLVNAVDMKYEGYIPKSFVETVRRMSTLEALVLRRMADAPPEAVGPYGMMYTGALPDGYLARPAVSDKDFVEPAPHVSLALAALIAAGCVHAMPTMSGSYVFSQAQVTKYGQELLRACSPIIDGVVKR